MRRLAALALLPFLAGCSPTELPARDDDAIQGPRSHFAARIALFAMSLIQPDVLRLSVGEPVIQRNRELHDVIGDEARTVIASAIEQFLAMPINGGQARRDVSVIAAQVPREWLPRIEDVQFHRIDVSAAQEKWQTGCDRLLWLTARRTGDALSIGVTQGHKCLRLTSDYHFYRKEGRWVPSTEIGGGLVSGTTGCTCK